MSQLNYPAAAQAHNGQGQVVIGFVVDTLGHVGSYRVLRSVGCTVPDRWVPGLYSYRLPFGLNEAFLHPAAGLGRRPTGSRDATAFDKNSTIRKHLPHCGRP